MKQPKVCVCVCVSGPGNIVCKTVQTTGPRLSEYYPIFSMKSEKTKRKIRKE